MSITIHHPTNRPNFSILNLPGLRVAFSYETPIAFAPALTGWVLRRNDWGRTTGGHLNYLNPDKSVRVPGDLFEGDLARAIEDAKLNGRMGL